MFIDLTNKTISAPKKRGQVITVKILVNNKTNKNNTQPFIF